MESDVVAPGLQCLDWVVISVYFLALVAIVWWSSKKQDTTADYCSYPWISFADVPLFQLLVELEFFVRENLTKNILHGARSGEMILSNGHLVTA